MVSNEHTSDPSDQPAPLEPAQRAEIDRLFLRWRGLFLGKWEGFRTWIEKNLGSVEHLSPGQIQQAHKLIDAESRSAVTAPADEHDLDAWGEGQQ